MIIRLVLPLLFWFVFSSFHKEKFWELYVTVTDGDSIITAANKDYGFGLKKCDLADSSLSCYMAFPFPNKGDEIRFKQYFDEIDHSKFILFVSNHKEKSTMQVFFEIDEKLETVKLKKVIEFQKGEFELDKQLKVLTAR